MDKPCMCQLVNEFDCFSQEVDTENRIAACPCGCHPIDYIMPVTGGYIQFYRGGQTFIPWEDESK